jgi:CheY-like chemotaxis protein
VTRTNHEITQNQHEIQFGCRELRKAIDKQIRESYADQAVLTAPPDEPTTKLSYRMSVQQESSIPESTLAAPSVEGVARRRVLLAEDDRALRRFLEVVLDRAGYKVIPAADGLEAMKLALSTQIDIVVTDAMMPNLSGHEFCRFLRNSQTLAHVPVILLSALEQRENNPHADDVDEFLPKPVSGDDLVACIQKLLARR